MNFQHIKTYCTVLRERSMTAAAKRLHLTQPAVSQQIQQLEEDLGTQLLIRGSRKIQATPQGEIFFQYAKDMMELATQAKLAIETTHKHVSGVVRVGTLSSIGLHFMGPVFAIFLKNNLSVQLKLGYAKGMDVLQQLQKAEIDVAIVPNAACEYGGDPRDLEKEILIRDEMNLVASTSDLELPKSIKLAELASRPIVRMVEEYPEFDHLLNREMKKAGISNRPVFESSNAGTLKRVIESGVGWGFLPGHTIQKQLNQGRFRKIPVEDFRYPFELACYYRKDDARTKAVTVFINGIREIAQEPTITAGLTTSEKVPSPKRQVKTQA